MEWGTLFGAVKDTVLGAITAIVPLGLGIFGVVFAVRKGIQILKSSSGR